MKLSYRTRNNRMLFELEGANLKELFRAVGEVQLVFETEEKCGACQSVNIRYQHRKAQTFDYFELICNDCRARFEFGQLKGDRGLLFPKRRDEDGRPLANGGWIKWEKPKQTGAA